MKIGGMEKKRGLLFFLAAMAFLLVSSPGQAPELEGEPPEVRVWDSERLPNGVTVHVLCVPEAPVQAAFSLLPLGLGADPLGRAQFAHLAEHMLIRSVDPEGFVVDGVEINGETTAQGLRLESIGPPDKWREVLLRHPRWLTARVFEEGVLEREKQRIAEEEKGTVAGGFNHKWAMAAWAQLVEGQRQVAVHGDVAAATLAQIEDYVRDRVRLSEVQIIVSGPKPSEEVVAVLREGFAAVELEPAAEPSEPVEEESPSPPTPGHLEARWDLAPVHYLEWYPLPDSCSGAEAELLTQAVSVAGFQQPDLRSLPGRGLAVIVRRDNRRYLLLSATSTDQVDIEALQTAFAAALTRAPALFGSYLSGETFAAQFDARPDFEAQRGQITSPRLQRILEASWAMNCAYAGLRLGVPLDEVAAAYRTADTESIEALLSEHCQPEQRFSAELHPAK